MSKEVPQGSLAVSPIKNSAPKSAAGPGKLFPGFFHDVFVFRIQVIHHHIQNDADNFRIEAVIGAGQAAVQEQGAIFCYHIFEDFVASVQCIDLPN